MSSGGSSNHLNLSGSNLNLSSAYHDTSSQESNSITEINSNLLDKPHSTSSVSNSLTTSNSNTSLNNLNRSPKSSTNRRPTWAKKVRDEMYELKEKAKSRSPEADKLRNSLKQYRYRYNSTDVQNIPQYPLGAMYNLREFYANEKQSYRQGSLLAEVLEIDSRQKQASENGLRKLPGSFRSLFF